MSPLSGPLEGGTEIRVEGRDLGTDPSDVKGRILVGGSRCHLKQFNISTGFSCIVEKVRMTIASQKTDPCFRVPALVQFESPLAMQRIELLSRTRTLSL